MVDTAMNLKSEVTVALVGKYVELHDAYLSVAEALTHGGIGHAEVRIQWIDSETISPENVAEILKDVHGILVPGGFGRRGVEGKIAAIRYAREQRIPYLGICLGMQLGGSRICTPCLRTGGRQFSTEFDELTEHPVIDIMAEQKDRQVGGNDASWKISM
ncbi:MAG: hypothetical protein V8T10_03795 [Merdibacter sp.]